MIHVPAVLTGADGVHVVATVQGVRFDDNHQVLPAIIRHDNRNFGLVYHPAGNTSALCPPVYREASTQQI